MLIKTLTHIINTKLFHALHFIFNRQLQQYFNEQTIFFITLKKYCDFSIAPSLPFSFTLFSFIFQFLCLRKMRRRSSLRPPPSPILSSPAPLLLTHRRSPPNFRLPSQLLTIPSARRRHLGGPTLTAGERTLRTHKTMAQGAPLFGNRTPHNSKRRADLAFTRRLRFVRLLNFIIF